MCEGNSIMKELIENGSAISSTEKAIDDLDEIIYNMTGRIDQCASLIPEMILRNHIVLVKEQRDILKDKYKNLLTHRKELTDKLQNKLLETDQNNTIDTIDRIVMKLLAIDDIYAETHKVSNASIMSFVEDLLKKKKELITK